tara:strand:- start:4197 stop:4925 length:729 start_codon:yes stop_codon:yes gene_type:complete
MAETVQMEGNVTGSETPVPEVNEDRPEWLPEKFKSGEELSKAYGELEKQFTQSRQEASTSDAEQPEQEDQSDARQAVENAGLDFDAMNNEFAETGQLSEKTYADLEAKGIPKEMVDSYIEGQQAISVSYQNELYGQAGGEDNYNQMSEWASENMNESEIDAYNEAISSGNASQARLAIDGLLSRYRASGNAEPNLVGGKASSSVDTYQSWAQVTKEMGTPEYKKDPAFRNAVQKKLERSKLT